jgi:DNA-binding FadR family transcriptional regulator
MVTFTSGIASRSTRTRKVENGIGTKGVEGSRGVRIRTPKTSEVVADQIRGEIVRGKLKEGDSLPPEGQLMETLGISRPTLREAFRILEAENLISVVRGSRSGASVHQPRVEVAARYAGYFLESEETTIADLYEARHAIEPFVVRSLCRSDNKKALGALRKHFEYLGGLLGDDRQADFMIGVAKFHSLLVEVSGNKTLTFLNHLLLDLVSRHQVDCRRRNPFPHDTQKKRIQAAMKSFQRLLTLIEAKEEEAAVAHWSLHLKNSHTTWAGPGEGTRLVNSLPT